jgi:hypothetical protein
MTPYFVPQETKKTMTAEDKLQIANAKIDFQKTKILQLENELHAAQHLTVELAREKMDFNTAVARKVQELGISHQQVK